MHEMVPWTFCPPNAGFDVEYLLPIEKRHALATQLGSKPETYLQFQQYTFPPQTSGGGRDGLT